jgi:RNA polymerase sigma-70 factor (ECF subfamily)
MLRIVPPPPPGETGEDQTEDLSEDERLVAALKARLPGSIDALLARHGTHLRRVLTRVLGAHDSEAADVLQDVTVSAWQSIGRLVDARALKAWLTQIAVFTARGVIRRRYRNRWLSFFESVPDAAQPWASPELHEAARAVYRIFDKMPADERIPFALRMLEGLELEATAEACGTSLATVRRRLVKAERRFHKLARQSDALAPWMNGALPSAAPRNTPKSTQGAK